MSVSSWKILQSDVIFAAKNPSHYTYCFKMPRIRLILRDCLVFRKSLILLILPIIFLPLICGAHVNKVTVFFFIN